MSTYTTPVPGGAGYAQASLLAKNAWDVARTRIQQQRGNLLRQYGYNQGADGSLSVDANNPYGKYQQMLHGQATESDQAGNQARGAGWGGSSGMIGRVLENLRYNQGGQQADLGMALQGGMSDLAGQDQSAETDYNNALYEAELQAARDAVDKGNYSPGDYSDLPPEPYPSTAKPPKKKASPAKAKRKVVKAMVERRRPKKGK